MALLVICPKCEPIDEKKRSPSKVQAVGVGIPRRHFIKHMELVHGLKVKG